MIPLLQFFSGIPFGLFLPFLPVDLTKEPVYFQVIISEVMADPTPAVRIPEAEYVELYNRGKTAVNLEGWKLAFGSHEETLTAFTLDPDNYLIVCECGTESIFHSYGKTMALSNMPAIVNTGQTLTLRSPSGVVIHTVSFSPDWFSISEKTEGGWSLEIIDPDNPCGYAENWHESINQQGGTPGSVNSVKGLNPDVQSPRLLRATLPNDSSVVLLFNERMDSLSLNSPSLYSADMGLLHPLQVIPVGPDYSSVMLTYSRRFQPYTIHSITVLNTLKDCVGNTLTPNSLVRFAIPQIPEGFDVIFNEVLFNAISGTSEFIELYNRSSKVLDLEDFSISLADRHTGDIIRRVFLQDHPFLLFPDGYAVITRDAAKLRDNKDEWVQQAILEKDELFSLPDEEGILVLSYHQSLTMDEFHYYRSMQEELLVGVEGVSLERVNSDKPASSTTNWHSASTAAGYSTPGRKNSQAMATGISGEVVTVQPGILSPDNDGIDDFIVIQVQPGEPGWMATIQIFDKNGNKMRTLACNTLLGTLDCFTWDGTRDDQRPAPIGIYLVYVEIFSKTGAAKKIKKVVTLTKRL
jgi:hypothetical protein